MGVAVVSRACGKVARVHFIRLRVGEAQFYSLIWLCLLHSSRGFVYLIAGERGFHWG